MNKHHSFPVFFEVSCLYVVPVEILNNSKFSRARDPIICGLTTSANLILTWIANYILLRAIRIGHKVCSQTHFLIGSWHCADLLFLQVAELCTASNRTLLHILTLETYGKFVWQNEMLALGVCLPQPCSSADRMFVTDHICIAIKQFVRFHKNEFDEMEYSTLP